VSEININTRRIVLFLFMFSFVLQLPLLNYITDDTFNMLMVGKNIANGNGFSFSPGTFAWAYTPVLPAFISGFFHMLSFSHAILAAKLISSFLTSVSVLAIFILAKKVIKNTKISLLVCFLWAINPWLIRYSFSGLETSIFSVFLIASAIAFKRNTFLGSILVGLTCLIRPDAWLFFPLLLIFSIKKRKNLFFLVISFLILFTWLVYSFYNFGTIFPTGSKSLHFHISTFNILFFFTEFFVLFPPFIVSLKYLKNQEDWLYVLLVCGAVFFYIFIGTGSPRYMAGFTPIFLVYAFFGAKEAIKNSHMFNGITMIFIAKTLLSLIFVYSFYSVYINDFRMNHYAVAEWIKHNTPENITIYVASFPGTITYISGRDTIGIHPDIFPNSHMFIGKESEYIKLKKPDYMYVPEETSKETIGELYPYLTKIMSGQYTTFSLVNINITFTLYRINW
jgi:hypothetical protein